MRQRFPFFLWNDKFCFRVSCNVYLQANEDVQQIVEILPAASNKWPWLTSHLVSFTSGTETAGLGSICFTVIFQFSFFFPFSLINSGFLSNHSPGRTFPIITDKEKTDFLSTDTFLSFQCSPIRTKFVSKIKEIQCRVPPIWNKSCVMMSVISSNIKLRETPMAGKFGVVVTFLTQSHIFICD